MPAKEFYDSLDNSIQKKFKWILNELSANRLSIDKDKNRKLDPENKIYELKIRYDNAWYRLTYASKDNYILLTGFQKKSNSTPQNEIDKAIQCAKNYDKSHKGKQVIL